MILGFFFSKSNALCITYKNVCINLKTEVIYVANFGFEQCK